jgi:S-DNA-T family DNA segregation ATPase FtsK/SpoIIIE
MHRRPPFRSDTTATPRPDSNATGEGLDVDEVIVVPRRADPAPRSPFPLIGSLAPLGVAVIVWFVLHSPLALVFALLSPVMAAASLVDARLHGRRARRRDDADVARRRRVFSERVEVFHAREIEMLERSAPSARSILERSVNPFTATAAGQPTISLGLGVVKSAIRVEGGVGEDDMEARQLRAAALQLKNSPVLASSPARIAVVGAWPLVHSLARGYALQLAAAISPDAVVFLPASQQQDQGHGDWDWARSLPHFGDDAIRLGPVEGVRRPLGNTFIVVADSLDEVPAEATVVISADSASGVAVLRHPRLITPCAIEGDFVSVVQATSWCDRLRRQSGTSSRVTYELPSSVSSTEIDALCRASGTAAGPPPVGLAAVIGLGGDGELFSLDLVEQGPHAVVAGTTGSGKSELLVTWVAALARAYDSSRFTVLLVDFKGGAAFDPLVGLEQCVGLITDLDPGAAERALSSLRAEIRWREKTLRDAGARDISDPRLVGRLARLLIVVDEFAAMLSEFPQLHDVFADIAARGRSLGMHLVLCTQRPSGVVRDSLLANCELRLSLRVNNAADSTAIIGTPAASALPAEHRGRCLVSAGGRAPVTVQIAHTDGTMLLHRAAPSIRKPRAPWLPALPRRIMLADVPRGHSGLSLGLLDLPDEQRQPTAVYGPAEDGPLLILGSARSGKSNLVATIAHQAPSAVVVAPGIESSWDSVAGLVVRCSARPGEGDSPQPVVVLIDDLDSLLRRFEPEYQAEMVGALTTILRDGPASGVTLVATAQRMGAPLTALAPLFPERILLRFASRQEYIVAEGVARDHDPQLPPGAGHWRGSRLQVAVAPPAVQDPGTPATENTRPVAPSELPLLLVVASRPALYLDVQGRARSGQVRLIDVSDRAALAAFAPNQDQPTWLVGTPDAWVSAWSTFANLRGIIPVYFDGCSLSEFRSLTRRRELPPAVETGTPARWLLTPDGEITRFDMSRLADG